MPRPRKCRRVCSLPKTEGFVPCGRCSSDQVILRVDEYEAIRLLDLESLTQEECAEQMDIARTTVTAIYASARQKIADALVNGKSLRIEGGEVVTCENSGGSCMGHRKHCCKRHMENE